MRPKHLVAFGLTLLLGLVCAPAFAQVATSPVR